MCLGRLCRYRYSYYTLLAYETKANKITKEEIRIAKKYSRKESTVLKKINTAGCSGGPDIFDGAL
jgi:hypothetical protein